ncbi:uncharacterized protein LOC131875189 [Cryptomeria japonica]|uniref:uncharacterized protein LOC131875189 n=1 Tax=Cryptomeria japonica TaxID=3369 RepID=UPI0027DA9965|nr:uncharacterized protein LOC131875189 [Cryptomeria japonica]
MQENPTEDEIRENLAGEEIQEAIQKEIVIDKLANLASVALQSKEIIDDVTQQPEENVGNMPIQNEEVIEEIPRSKVHLSRLRVFVFVPGTPRISKAPVSHASMFALCKHVYVEHARLCRTEACLYVSGEKFVIWYPMVKKMLSVAMGNRPFIVNGQNWSQQRRIVVPAFRMEKLNVASVHRSIDKIDELKGFYNEWPECFRDGISKATDNHPYTLIPFSGGPTACISQNYDLLEAKVVVSMMMKSFRFSVSRRYRHAPVSCITLNLRHGIPIVVEKIACNRV